METGFAKVPGEVASAPEPERRPEGLPLAFEENRGQASTDVRYLARGLGHDLQGYCEERYNLIGRAGHWWESHDASACEGCQACLPRCPHELPIPDLLAETHALLSAPPRRRLWG